MWNFAAPFGFGGAVRNTAAFIRPNRIVRDLSGLPAVLGRFGPFEVRLATTTREIRKAQRLRFKVFCEEGGATPQQRGALTRRDICRFDKICDHLLVIDKDQLNRFGRKKPKIVGVYRLLRGDTAARHQGFYSETEFDIAPLLARQPGKRFLELGRSCVDAQYRSKRVIELLWRGLWVYAKHHRIDVLIGCASLPGVDPLALALPLSFLHCHALADEEWRVRPLAGRGVNMAILETKAIDARKGVAALPPLLKAYLRAGAKFGDGAVIDAQFGTTDVFTIMPLSDMEDRYLNYYGGPMEMPESYVA
ncbi:MAG TPA: GNAT family N-acyltransferase [Methylocella sp.]|nr:GNAT family N-acyltransferase [Methylocella sp.]